jgi:hypothetical protein
VTLTWPDRAALAHRAAQAPGRVQAYLQRRAEQADDAWIERHAVEIDAVLDRSARVDLRFRWSEACKRVGLGQQVVTPLGGTGTAKIPRPVSVTLGPPDRLVIEMPPGAAVADLEHYGPELAEALGCWRLRFTPITAPYIKVSLIDVDPAGQRGSVPAACTAWSPGVRDRRGRFGDLDSGRAADAPDCTGCHEIGQIGLRLQPAWAAGRRARTCA